MKGKEAEYDYGECEIFYTPMQEKCIKQDFWIGRGTYCCRRHPCGVMFSMW
jgi:hypothetical protein